MPLVTARSADSFFLLKATKQKPPSLRRAADSFDLRFPLRRRSLRKDRDSLRIRVSVAAIMPSILVCQELFCNRSCFWVLAHLGGSTTSLHFWLRTTLSH